MLFAWKEQADRLSAGEVSVEEYDRWRYHYPNLVPVSYCASRTSADFSGKPSSIPRYFCVMPLAVRKKWIL